MEPQADQNSDLSFLAKQEMWRYQAIAKEPWLPERPPDWLLNGDCVIVNILGSWTLGAIMDFGGTSHSESNPKTFAVCASPERHNCDPKECDSGCLERFWAKVSYGGVLGKKDLLRIYLGSGPNGLFDPLNLCRDQKLAKQFLNMIEEIEARYKKCQQ